MELTHSFTVPADPERAWQLLTDLHRVGSCFPGATVTEADAEEFSGTVKVKLGPVALTYAGTGKFVERDDAAHRAVIEARGKDRRGNGTASATVTMSLTAEGDATRAEVVTDLSVTGKPAQFGRGVMQDVSDKLLGQFVACIEGQFSEAGDGATGHSGAAEAAAGVPAPAAVPAAAAEVPAPARTRRRHGRRPRWGGGPRGGSWRARRCASSSRTTPGTARPA
ncbi:SRPBCC family protein [Georgenia sp. SUBG003]|uniref:SRPBCC family protein n=1 Tax=Georgenia sp. SUBG003 TaxID=1497974 RepID=UPI003AB6BA94